jgi:hypothetical protein
VDASGLVFAALGRRRFRNIPISSKTTPWNASNSRNSVGPQDNDLEGSLSSALRIAAFDTNPETINRRAPEVSRAIKPKSVRVKGSDFAFGMCSKFGGTSECDALASRAKLKFCTPFPLNFEKMLLLHDPSFR